MRTVLTRIMERVLRDRKAILLFVGPALLLYVLVLLIPIVWSIGYTFWQGSPITGFEFASFDNYLELVEDRNFRKALWFSVRYAAVVTTGQIIFGLLLALLYAFYLKRASALIRTLVFFPVVLPTVAVAQMFVKFFAIAPQYGLVNAVLQRVGLESLIQAWLGAGQRDDTFDPLYVQNGLHLQPVWLRQHRRRHAHLAQPGRHPVCVQIRAAGRYRVTNQEIGNGNYDSQTEQV